ncbi:MAG: GGDEF domain-containing protein [Psychrobium sp.]
MQRLNLPINELESIEFTSIAKEFSDNANAPVRRALDKLDFLQKLSVAIELQPLLAIYAREVSMRLQITGLEFEYQDQVFQPKYSQGSCCVLSSQLFLHDKSLGTMRYLSTKPLAQPQRQLIASLEQQLLQPLNNVLIFEHNRRLSLRDHLTGLGNRSYFDETLSSMKATAQREDRPFSLLMLDLDNFKQVNDQHGHAEGDAVLKQFAKILRDALRSNDYVFRFGGDEFVLLLAHSDSLNPGLVAQRIIDNVCNDALLNGHHVTTSIGITNWQQGDCSAAMVERADKALYQAKSDGKNNYRSL